MKLYHITPRVNLPQILRQGLRVEFCADLFEKYIALCGPTFLAHWRSYLASSYGIHQDKLATLTINIPFYGELSFCSKAYYSMKDIPPDCIVGRAMLLSLHNLKTVAKTNGRP